jgi:hypothetical protein
VSVHNSLTALFFTGFWLLTGAVADAAPAIDANVHLGVATCDSSNCHGKTARQTDGNVWLNEYRVWRSQDYHARAYRTLSSAESKLIARKLGLQSAASADICLNCHADNVPGDKRGAKFQISDGVGCEACHGGADQWIDSHDNPDVTHAENISNGMYPTDDPAARAQICLACHMGTTDRFVTHRIMGAGHPRLSFELENFTFNQPPHFEVDDDYRQRKGEIEGVELWVVGQLEAGRRFLDLLNTEFYATDSWAPEFSLYDCQACHHGLDPDDLRWSVSRRSQGIEPGSLRLQNYHFQMLEIVSQVLSAGDTAELRARGNALIVAGQKNRSEALQAAASMRSWIDEQQRDWLSSGISSQQIRKIRRLLVDAAASGTVVDYGTAEQGLLSIVTLTTYLGDDARLADAIDALFDSLGNDEAFRPPNYAAAAKRVVERF